jgi:hypothetical protein
MDLETDKNHNTKKMSKCSVKERSKLLYLERMHSEIRGHTALFPLITRKGKNSKIAAARLQNLGKIILSILNSV